MEATHGSYQTDDLMLRDLYSELCTGEHGVSIDTFMRELYFLQHRQLTIFDIREAFYSSTSMNERFLTYREFHCALTKIAQYHESPRHLVEEIRTIQATQKEIIGTLERYQMDEIRKQMLKASVLDTLERYGSKLSQSFQLYSTDHRVDTSLPVRTTSTMSIDGFVDFLNAYFEYEAFFSYQTLEQMALMVIESFPIMSFPDQKQLLFPHFIELFCRVASQYHILVLEREGSRLRKAVESCRLEFSIESLMEHMNIRIFKDEDKSSYGTEREPNTSRSAYDGLHDLTLDLDPDETMNSTESILREIKKMIADAHPSQPTHTYQIKRLVHPIPQQQSVLFARLPPRKGEGRPQSVPQPRQSPMVTTSKPIRPFRPPEVTLIHEVVAPPLLPRKVLQQLEYAITYQNTAQYHMALDALDKSHLLFKRICKDNENAGSESNEVKVFFSLMIAGVYDSARKDLKALGMYLEALRHSSLLPIRHPGRALVKSCLGCMLYYLGYNDLAIKCHEQVLHFRRSHTSSLTGEETGQDEDVNVATALNNLACCISQEPDASTGSIEIAYLHLKTAKRIYLQNFGPSHPRVEIVTRNFERVLACQNAVVVDPIGALARGEYAHVIPGSRFQINALVPLPATKGKKKKKKGVKNGKKKK